jgi:uncharacterized protein YndB with AHSA1/START domain
MWFHVEPSDVHFLSRAPFEFNNEAVIAAPPERVFEIFATGERQAEWFKDFVEQKWTSSEPHGVGATREVELKMLRVKERFFTWEQGKRLSFSIDAITLPIVAQMAEDLQFEPSGKGSTWLRWRAVYTPAPLMRIVHPVARTIFGKMFRASLDGLNRYVARTT